MKIISIQKQTKDVCLVQVSDQLSKVKFDFYCPSDCVGRVVELNIQLV